MSTKPGLITVVVPARNAATVIHSSIESLLAQTYEGAWELVVVDNDSTDDTSGVASRAIEEPWPQGLQRAEVLRFTERHGYASPRNHGVLSTSGDLLAFCDADDRVAPDWLEALADAADEAPLLCSVQIVSKERPAENSPPEVEAVQVATSPVKFGVRVAHTGGMGCARWLFDRLGGFDPHFDLGGEDVDFSIRARTVAGTEPVLVERARYFVVGRPSSTSTFKQAYRNGRSQVRLFARHQVALEIPDSAASELLRRLKLLLRKSTWLFDSGRRSAWIQIAGVTWGRVVWSIRLRVKSF